MHREFGLCRNSLLPLRAFVTITVAESKPTASMFLYGKETTISTPNSTPLKTATPSNSLS